MGEKRDAKGVAGLNRRSFIGALGAAAAAGAFLDGSRGGAAAQNAQCRYYQDSFGRIVPAGLGTLALGIEPPPIPGLPFPNESTPPASGAAPEPDGGCVGTFYSSEYPKYNILLIMVDQMRNPNFWPPQSGPIIGPSGPIPNISGLMQNSWQFPNYFVAATVCGPSRACLLTGLYTQQTGIFKSQRVGPPGNAGSTNSPPLLPWYGPNWTQGDPPGFPTIGNVLSQSLCNYAGGSSAYDCTWIGKWHLSCGSGKPDGSPGQYGPSDYGFNGNGSFNIPNAATPNPYPRGLAAAPAGYPSPNGMDNEGNGGDFLDSLGQPSPTRDIPNFGTSLPYGLPGNFLQLNDAAIQWAFTDYWLPNAEKNLTGRTKAGALAKPWFCAVSFINPHDIGGFPYAYGMTAGETACPIPAGNSELYCVPSNPDTQGYLYPPPADAATTYLGTHCLGGSSDCAADGDTTTITQLPANYSGVPGNWNWEDQSATPYTAGAGNNPKPGLQQYFQNARDNASGEIVDPGTNPSGWQTFLNYYLWMESCVDYQVGQVLKALYASAFSTNTVVIFTSDHGEYGGSHGLRAKGGALYEEVINVPLLISYPEARAKGTSPPSLPYVCSSVDLLPFIYSLALGNNTWRFNVFDIVYYLRSREAINDAIYQYSHNATQAIQQYRISNIPLNKPLVPFPTQDWQSYQPFILHTADDYTSATSTLGANQPSHAIAFRTVDQTDPIANPANGQTVYGGGKLGVYSYWDTCDANGLPLQSISLFSGNNAPDAQFEFYNFSPHPPGGDSPPPSVNVLELDNSYLAGPADTGYYAPGESDLYTDNFFGFGTWHGINVQSELYYNLYISPFSQVGQAIQTAFNNYILFLNCNGQQTGIGGTPVNQNGCPAVPTCTNCVSGAPCGEYEG